MPDAERREIVADQRHHGVDRAPAEHGQPVALRRLAPALAVLLGDPAADRDQIVAGIEALGARADAAPSASR